MGVRTRIGDGLARVAKTFGTSVPESFTQGEEAAQMTPASPFSPGTPIGPYDGYDRHPRTLNFTTGYNIATRPRLHEAVSFSTLTGLVESYDVCQIAIWHRIDSIRSLDWKLLPADHCDSDVTDAIPLGLAALRKPDRKNSFKTWLAKYLYDILAWDAGTLYRLRNRAGRCIGLMPIDGRTLAPLLDYWGNSPDEPAEAYVQYVNGLPWNWLTRADIIYEPFRPVAGSPYGRPPIESVLLNSNTDIRHQIFFLQFFTEGNLPAAFASSPDSWSPDQIEQFQQYWDAMMYGDQARKQQVRWMPGGTKIMWSNEKEFSDHFSMYLMRKTLAAFHVVPSDVGFTENVNRSSGESQADVQHRVGDLPLMEHIEGILSAFLLDDLGLPLKFEFDRGEEQVDQLAQAEADQRYMDRGVVGASEIREMRYGLTDAVPIPRVFFTERAGPIPLSSLEAVAGTIDPQTAAPEPGSPLPHQVFTETPGVQPNPPLYGQPLAEEIYGPSAIPPHTETQSTMPVAKEDGGAAGITSGTGVYSYDLEGRDDDEAEPDGAEQVRKELAAFRNFRKKRRQSGEWHDFEFRHVPADEGARLNAAGRQSVRKDGTPGLTSRSGMISLDLPPGIVEPPPGGVTDQHVTVVYLGSDVDDEAFAAACDRAAAAAALVPGPLTAQLSGVSSFPPSAGSDGKVPAFVPVTIPGAEVLREALADLSASEHKDWHPHVTLAYLEPGEPLPEPCEPVTAVLTHLSVHRGGEVVRFALGCTEGAAEQCCGGECCQGGCCNGASGCGCGAGDVAKAGDAGPKAFRPPTLDVKNLTGVWAEIYDRREKLLRRHLKAVAAAWDACLAELGSPAGLVRQFRADAGIVAKLADEGKPWWKDKGTAAALAWLLHLSKTKGYPALVAALEDAIRSGMAEGEADALALAADRQGAAGFQVDRAFRAAYDRLAGDAKVAQQAQDAAAGIVDGAAGDAGRALADQAEDDGSDDDMASAVDDVLSGDRSQAVGLGVDWWLFAAILGGALALYSRAASPAEAEQPEAGPEQPPPPPPVPPPGPVLLNWITAGDSRVCPTCSGYEDNSPYTPSAVPDYPHPRCRCSVDLAPESGSSLLGALLDAYSN